MTSSGESAPSFGYLPDLQDVERVLERAEFVRALALDVPVKAAFGRVAECRILWDPEVDLPSGVYWFEGIDEGSMVMQVGGGGPPGGAVITALQDLTQEDPLMVAWSWAEQLWSIADSVPAPLFSVDDTVITSPGDADGRLGPRTRSFAHLTSRRRRRYRVRARRRRACGSPGRHSGRAW